MSMQFHLFSVCHDEGTAASGMAAEKKVSFESNISQHPNRWRGTRERLVVSPTKFIQRAADSTTTEVLCILDVF